MSVPIDDVDGGVARTTTVTASSAAIGVERQSRVRPREGHVPSPLEQHVGAVEHVARESSPRCDDDFTSIGHTNDDRLVLLHSAPPLYCDRVRERASVIVRGPWPSNCEETHDDHAEDGDDDERLEQRQSKARGYGCHGAMVTARGAL